MKFISFLPFLLSLTVCGRGGIVFESNLRPGDFDGFTDVEIP